MKLDIQKLSDVYDVRRIKQQDLKNVYAVCKGNPQYFQCMHSPVTMENLKQDLVALPPNTTLEDKYFVGFYLQDRLIAFMDLILGYPNEHSAWIGWFMMDHELQGKGTGTSIITQVLHQLQKARFSCVQLGYVEANQQSEAFWKKNNFLPTGRKVPMDDYVIVNMQKML